MRKIIDFFVINVSIFGRRERIASFSREKRPTLSKIMQHCKKFTHNASHRPNIYLISIVSLQQDYLRSSIPSCRYMRSKKLRRFYNFFTIFLLLFLLNPHFIFHFLFFITLLKVHINCSCKPKIA